MNLQKSNNQQNKSEIEWIIQTDGKCIVETGEARSIALFNKKCGESNRYYWTGRNSTNNIAEYMGVITALEHLPNNSKAEIQTDSQLVVGQLTYGWKINKAHLYELINEVNRLIKEKNLDITFKQIPREENNADLVLGRHLKKEILNKLNEEDKKKFKELKKQQKKINEELKKIYDKLNKQN